MKTEVLIAKIRRILKMMPVMTKDNFYFLAYEDLIKCECAINGVLFKSITDQNCEDLLLIRNAETVESFRKMYQQGQYCLGAYMDGSIIGHCSLIFPRNRHNQVLISKSGFIHFCYVAPEYRGRNIYPRMLEELVRRTHDQYGIERFSISTTPQNVASQRGLKKIGFSAEEQHTSLIWWKFVIGKVFV